MVSVKHHKTTFTSRVGTIARCDFESGSPVLIPGISDDPCISCTCEVSELMRYFHSL